jgi:gamma-glutamyl-gamma-aminobutyrate hydrolase PuuD
MRLVVAGQYYNAEMPFMDLFKDQVILNLGRSLDGLKLTSNDVVLFGGGADISPSLYGQKKNRHTGATDQPSARDTQEKIIFGLAVEAKAKMLGICRGAQLVCALSGGSLVQHVNNHSGPDHDMTTKEGTVINVCSVHHQMMNPFKVKHELIAWASRKLSNVYLIENDKDIEVDVEPEVVYFPETRALGIQYHPEFMGMKDEAVIYARALVSQYLLKG